MCSHTNVHRTVSILSGTFSSILHRDGNCVYNHKKWKKHKRHTTPADSEDRKLRFLLYKPANTHSDNSPLAAGGPCASSLCICLRPRTLRPPDAVSVNPMPFALYTSVTDTLICVCAHRYIYIPSLRFTAEPVYCEMLLFPLLPVTLIESSCFISDMVHAGGKPNEAVCHDANKHYR